MAIFLTAGIGDFLALDSLGLPYASEYYLATPAQEQIAELLHLRDSSAKIHKLWRSEFTTPCFMTIRHYNNIAGDTLQAEDWSIAKQFYYALVSNAYRPSFLHTAALPELLDYPQLKQPYCVIQASTTRDKSLPKRLLDPTDWQAIESHLKANNLLGVVVNDRYEPTPPSLLNLSGELSILQTMAVMRKATGYLGIDSFLSVFAAQLPLSLFRVKTNRQHCRDWKEVYYKPHTSFSFLVDAM